MLKAVISKSHNNSLPRQRPQKPLPQAFIPNHKNAPDMTEQPPSQRIARNTVVLYARMLFTMWFNLWATRLVLANLGTSDMGVYSVVGSIVAFFSVLTAGVTVAVQRFVTFEQGRKDGNPSLVFSSSVNIILLFAVGIVVLLEAAGVPIINYTVNIPEGRMAAARWVFQFSVITSVITLLQVPYNAVIIAHERMDAYAVISILQVLMNWGAAYCLSYIGQDSRLTSYGVLMAVAAAMTTLLYIAYSTIKFPEARYHFVLDKQLLKQLGKFTGTSTASNVLYTLSAQGIVLVINWTFGVAVNAVYQIALQLKNAVLSFGLNIFKAISPQITKTYAEGDTVRHKALVYTGSKAEAYMILLIMVPFICRAPYIMHLWLGQVPPYATAFCICSVFLSLSYSIFEPIRTAVYATGRIARFLLIPDTVYLVVVLALSYAVGKITDNPVLMMLTVVAMDIACCALRVWYAREVTFVRFRELAIKVLMPVLAVALLSSLVCLALTFLTPETILGLLLLLLINTLAALLIIYGVGINKSERELAKVIVGGYFHHRHN